MTEAEAVAQRALDRFGFLVIRSVLDLPRGHICDHIANRQGIRTMEATMVVLGPAELSEEEAILDFLGVSRWPLGPDDKLYKVAAE